jgi:hypothetical protein
MGWRPDRSLTMAGALAVAVVVALASWAGTSHAAGRNARAPTTSTPSDVHRYLLRPASDGTYAYDGPQFSATITQDGTVSFHAKRGQPRSRLGEIISGQGEGRQPEDWPIVQPTPMRPTPYDDRETGRDLDPIGAPRIPLAEPIFIDSGLRFDLTDEYARRMGADPLRDAKAAFLADTFDFRTGLASRQHQQALAQLPAELEAIWRDQRFSPAERRQIIYFIWQETSDDDAGKQARQIIQAYARRTFSPGDAARFKE